MSRHTRARAVCVAALVATTSLTQVTAAQAESVSWNDTYQPGQTTITHQFSAVGAEQRFVVPEGVTQVDLTLIGAPGGSSNTASGGLGALVAVNDVTVAPGDTLWIEVGSASNVLWGPGLFNGGGRGWRNGGGATDVRTESASVVGSLNTRIAVAGGGGGAGGQGSGGAGGAAGQAGSTSRVGNSAGGNPGTATNGGGGNAGFGVGGGTWNFGGGGGGGWFGGGPGQDTGPAGGGGGGGSSHVPEGPNSKILPGDGRPPQALISYAAPQGRLQQRSSGKCATAPAAARGAITLNTCALSTQPLFARQQFRWVYLGGDGVLNLYMPGSQMCVDSQKVENGAYLVAATCSASSSQSFAKTQMTDLYDSYKQQVVGTDFRIDTAYGSTAENTPLVIGTASTTGSLSQQWRRLANPGA